MVAGGVVMKRTHQKNISTTNVFQRMKNEVKKKIKKLCKIYSRNVLVKGNNVSTSVFRIHKYPLLFCFSRHLATAAMFSDVVLKKIIMSYRIFKLRYSATFYHYK